MTCASCSRPVCACPDLVFAGIAPPSARACPLSLGARGVTAGSLPPAAGGDLINGLAGRIHIGGIAR